MAELMRRAGQTPLSVYARSQLFPANDNRPVTSSAAGTPIRDRTALAKLLAKLGQSELGSSFREFSQFVRLGGVPILPQTEAAIEQICREISEIKSLLMKALGIREK